MGCKSLTISRPGLYDPRGSVPFPFVPVLLVLCFRSRFGSPLVLTYPSVFIALASVSELVMYNSWRSVLPVVTVRQCSSDFSCNKILLSLWLELGSSPCLSHSLRIWSIPAEEFAAIIPSHGTGESCSCSRWVISTCLPPSSPSLTSVNPHPKSSSGLHFFASRNLSKPSQIRRDRS